MNRTNSIVILGMLLVNGCGLPPLHPLTLVFPENDCSQMPGLCLHWKGCDALNIHLIEINVGPFSSERTEFICVANSPTIKTQAYYHPGKEYYLIDAKYEHDGSMTEVSAGPFSEDEAVTPWILPLR